MQAAGSMQEQTHAVQRAHSNFFHKQTARVNMSSNASGGTFPFPGEREPGVGQSRKEQLPAVRSDISPGSPGSGIRVSLFSNPA